MKKLSYILGGLIAIALCIFAFIFSPWGNSIISSYAQDIIKEKSGVDVKFENFKLGFSKVEISAKINGEIAADIAGDLSLFSQSLNLSYKIEASSLKSANLALSEPISLSGEVRGKFSDFDANGAGKALGSNINFLANVKDYKPFSATINAKSLKIADALALIAKPAYVSGLADVSAEIKELKGSAEILLFDAQANSALVSRDFNVTLPPRFTLKGAVNALINENEISAKSMLITPIASAKTSNSKYNLATSALSSDFTIDAPDLSKFEPIIKQSLKGSLKAAGDISLAQNKLQNLNATIDGLGGQIVANLKDGDLEAKILNIKLDELLKLAAQPPIASANISGTATLSNLDDIKKIKGNAKISTNAGKINKNELKKLTELNFAKDIDFSLNGDVSVQNSLANFNAEFLSELANFKAANARYDIAKNSLNANFSLDSSDLAKFESIVGHKLSGSLNLDGEIKTDANKIALLKANAKALGGTIEAQMIGENLKLEAKNTQIKDAFLLAGLEPLANAGLNLNANLSSIDPKNLNGELKIVLANGEIYEKAASKMLEKNFPSNVKFNGNADIKFEKSVANFGAKFDSTLLNLSQANGKFDINQNSLNANFKALIPELSRLKFATGRELKGPLEIAGDISKSAAQTKIDATSKIFGGDMKAVLKDNLLNATIENFTFKELSKTLNFDHIYDGVGDGELNYDISSQKGDFAIDINEGKLVANGFTNAFQGFTSRDLTSEIYKNGSIVGTVDKNLIKFDAAMSAQRSDINATNATFDTASGAMHIPLNMRYEKTDIKVDITGTKYAPKYSVSSDYLKEKATNRLDKLIDKKLGEDNATKDVVKGLLKGLF